MCPPPTADLHSGSLGKLLYYLDDMQTSPFGFDSIQPHRPFDALGVLPISPRLWQHSDTKAEVMDMYNTRM